MKVLSISTDRTLFDQNSSFFGRSHAYSEKMEGLHIVVFTLHKHHHKSFSVGNLHVYPTNSFSKLLYIFNARKLSKKIIEQNSFSLGDSVISTQDPFETSLVGTWLAKRTGIPLQIQLHTDFLSPHFSKTFLNKIRQYIAGYTIPKASGLRVVSEIIEGSLKNHFKNLKVEPQILPIFVDIEKIMETEPKRNLSNEFPEFKPLILMASRLSKEKRFDIAFHAIKKIKINFPHVGLVIAGSGPEKSNLEHLAKRLGITSNVKFIGWQDDLVSLYKTSNIFLLTSDYEGYGMTLIEAGAAGCMIVTTKVGIAKTPVFVDEENSHVCPVGDFGCIANCINNIIHDNQKRELFEHRIKASMKSIAIPKEEYVQRYVALLQGLCKNAIIK